MLAVTSVEILRRSYFVATIAKQLHLSVVGRLDCLGDFAEDFLSPHRGDLSSAPLRPAPQGDCPKML